MDEGSKNHASLGLRRKARPSISHGLEVPSVEEKTCVIAEISALGRELAAASETVQVYPREVEAVRRELQARGFMLPPEIARAIAAAFLADAVARAPAPRFRVASRA